VDFEKAAEWNESNRSNGIHSRQNASNKNQRRIYGNNEPVKLNSFTKFTLCVATMEDIYEF